MPIIRSVKKVEEKPFMSSLNIGLETGCWKEWDMQSNASPTPPPPHPYPGVFGWSVDISLKDYVKSYSPLFFFFMPPPLASFVGWGQRELSTKRITIVFGSHETSPIIWLGKPAPAIQC